MRKSTRRLIQATFAFATMSAAFFVTPRDAQASAKTCSLKCVDTCDDFDMNYCDGCNRPTICHGAPQNTCPSPSNYVVDCFFDQ